MGFSPSDFLPADILGEMQRNGAALFADPEVARAVVWRHQTGGPETHNAFTGKASKSGSTETISMIRAAVRDSQTDEVVAGRYKFMCPVASFTGAAPLTTDFLQDGGELYQVNAVRTDPTGSFYRFDVVRVTEA